MNEKLLSIFGTHLNAISLSIYNTIVKGELTPAQVHKFIATTPDYKIETEIRITKLESNS